MTKIEGVVLSRLEYGDSTLIVDVYSLQMGRTTFGSTISKKKNTRFYFSPLSLIQVDLTPSKKGKYYRSKEVSSLIPDQLVNRDSEIHAIRFFLADFLKKALREEESNPALFNFLKSKIVTLYQIESKGDFVLEFLKEISPFLGMDLHELSSNKSSAEDFGFTVSSADWSLLTEGPNGNNKAYLNALLAFYANQFEGVDKLKSKEVLAEIFA